MRDSFLRKFKIATFGFFVILGLLAVNKAAMAQVECIDCVPDTCFNDCFNEHANDNPADHMCCGKPCDSIRAFCDITCLCGNGQVDGCEECDGGENCSEDCKDVTPPTNDPPPPVTPVSFKGKTYTDWLALERDVNLAMNIEPNDPIMAAVKGITFGDPGDVANTNLKASVIGKNEWAAKLRHFEFYGVFPEGTNAVPMSNNNCLGPITQSSICMTSSGGFISCPAKGCREMSKQEWLTATTTSPQICPTDIGCCNQTATQFLPGTSTPNPAYTTRCTVPDTFSDPTLHNKPDGKY